MIGKELPRAELRYPAPSVVITAVVITVVEVITVEGTPQKEMMVHVRVTLGYAIPVRSTEYKHSLFTPDFLAS